MKSPQVSVIVPAYNHENYVALSIKSVLEQSYEDFELIIVNDGSTDKTENEVLKFDDLRIIYVTQENRGAHNTINRGIDLAKGEYISILNSDDVYYPKRLMKCLEFLEQNREYSVVITEVAGITGDGAPVERRNTPQILAWLNWYKEALDLYESRDFLLAAFAKNILITTSNYFMRKDVFEKVGKFRGLRYAHDWDMLLRLAQNCKIHLLRDVLLHYRIHETNTVLEADSEAKVKFEVNWLIAQNIRSLKQQVDVFALREALKENHYVFSDVLLLMLMVGDVFKAEQLLDFEDPTTMKIIELLK